MNNRRLLITVLLIVVCIVLGVVLLKVEEPVPPLKSTNQVFSDNSQWSEYRNEELGFSISYPVGLLTASEITHNLNQDNSLSPAKEVRFYKITDETVGEYSSAPISIWVQDAAVKNIDEWFLAVYGLDGDWTIATRREISGLTAISVSEKEAAPAKDNYDFSFVQAGKVWTITLDDNYFSTEELDDILSNFRLLD